MKIFHTWSYSTIFVASLFQNLILFSYLILECASEPKLLLLNVVFRHGDRAPDREIGESYPNNPNINETFYPMGSGGMTNEGKQRSYELGQFLRQNYSEFLGSIYLPKDIRARSTDSPRTKMSLQLVLAGLYPPDSLQKWNSDLDWQPIPFDYEIKKNDWLLWPTTCPKYIREYERVQKTSEVLTRINELKPFINKMTNFTGKEMKTMRDLLVLYNTLLCEKSMNLTIPEWANEYLENGELERVGKFQVEIRNYNTLLKRLNGGVLIRKMKEDIFAAKNGTLKKGQKIILYSGHDLNVGAQLLALGVTEPHNPTYTSAVILELYQDDKDYFVQVVYYLGIPSKAQIMKIPGCDEMCPLEKFFNLLKDVIPNDENQCQL